MMNSAHDIVNMNPAPPLLPDPIRPPSPSLNGISIFPSAPPFALSTSPVRKFTVRIPASAAIRLAFSHSRQSVGQKSLSAENSPRSKLLRRDPHKTRSRTHKQIPSVSTHVRANAASKIPRSKHPTLADRLFLSLSPAPRNRLSSQVDHRIKPGDRARPDGAQPAQLKDLQEISLRVLKRVPAPAAQPERPAPQSEPERGPNRPRSSTHKTRFISM